jgi:RHS repeat-associated protein
MIGHSKCNHNHRPPPSHAYRLAVTLLFGLLLAAMSLAGDTSAVYVNKYFEIRDHDAPTKYVFDAKSLVATVTGTISTNARVQRLRVHAGWNLASLAVTGTNTLAQLTRFNPELIQAAYGWNKDLSNWYPADSMETLPAGTVLWLGASTNGVLSLLGSYREPTGASLPPGGAFVASAGLVVWELSEFFLHGVTTWKYAPPTNSWLIGFPPPLQSRSELLARVAPGEAILVNSDRAVDLGAPDAALFIHYYHEDHLGSTSSITDSKGRSVREEEYYPFGATRVIATNRGAYMPYSYVQKERDCESGLSYFGRRYCSLGVGRFISYDPLGNLPPFQWLKDPQALNIYAYVANRPLSHVDVSGLHGSAVVAGMDFTVHQTSIDRSLWFLPIEDRVVLMNQQWKIDAPWSQTPENSHIHAMREASDTGPWETVEHAKERANEFARNEILEARRLQAEGKRTEALAHLGNAMHTLQDSTSPAHRGFQGWHGEKGFVNHLREYLHIVREFSRPQWENKELDEITLRAHQYFTGELPLPKDFFDPNNQKALPVADRNDPRARELFRILNESAKETKP